VKNNVVDGLSCNESKIQTEIRQSCIYGKSQRLPFPKKSLNRANRNLDLVHNNVCGPMAVEFMGGSRYFMTRTDNHLRWSDVFCIKIKSDVFGCFKKWKAIAERQSSSRIQTPYSDNGVEYMSGEFKVYLKKCGIKQELTVLYTPQQNEVAERLNRTRL
jgi:hypothetical protein